MSLCPAEYRELGRAVNFPIWWLTKNGDIGWASEWFYKFSGASPERIVDTPRGYTEFIPLDELGGVDREWMRVRHGAESIISRVPYRKKDRSLFYFRSFAWPVMDRFHRLEGWCGLSTPLVKVGAGREPEPARIERHLCLPVKALAEEMKRAVAVGHVEPVGFFKAIKDLERAKAELLKFYR